MRLIDAITNVTRPDDRAERYRYTAPSEPICEDLGITGMWYFPEEVDLVLKAFPIFNWICTDEHVGLDALWLGDEPVGCAFRPARKASYEIEWLSNEAADKVREFILSKAERPKYTLVNREQNIGEYFNVGFVTQALTHRGSFEARPVTALVWYDGLTSHSTPKQYRREGHPYVEAVPFKDVKSNCALVEFDDTKEQKVIPIEAFRLAFNLTKNVDEP